MVLNVYHCGPKFVPLVAVVQSCVTLYELSFLFWSNYDINRSKSNLIRFLATNLLNLHAISDTHASPKKPEAWAANDNDAKQKGSEKEDKHNKCTEETAIAAVDPLPH